MLGISLKVQVRFHIIDFVLFRNDMIFLREKLRVVRRAYDLLDPPPHVGSSTPVPEAEYELWTVLLGN
jgi:hypothetical protein